MLVEADPLSRFRALCAEHRALTEPMLIDLKRLVDERVAQIRASEHDNLRQQREALSQVRARLEGDARFLLRTAPFAGYAERLSRPRAWFSARGAKQLPRDTSRWLLALSASPLSLRCERVREVMRETDEAPSHVRLIDVGVTMGETALTVSLDEGPLCDADPQHEGAYCLFEEAAFFVEDALVRDGVCHGERALRLGREVAVVICYAARSLVQQPKAALFAYP